MVVLPFTDQGNSKVTQVVFGSHTKKDLSWNKNNTPNAHMMYHKNK